MNADRGKGGWLRWAALGYAAGMCVVVALRAQRGTDFRDFWETALHFRLTGQLSSELGVHNYLPAFSLLMVPFSFLPLPLAAVIFTLCSLAALWWTLRRVERWLKPITPEARWANAIAACLMLPYFTSCLTLGSLSLILLALMVFAIDRVHRGRDWTAGAAIGVGAVLKILPGVLLGHYALRTRWRVIAGALGAIALLGAGLPMMMLGPSECVRQHVAYYERAVRGASAYETIHAEKPRKAKYSNNALPITLRRLLSRVNADPSDDGRELYVNMTELPRPVIWTIYLGILGVILGASAGASFHRPGAAGESHNGHPAGDNGANPATRPTPLTPAIAAWCCVTLLAAPLVWTHYLPLAFPGLALVAAWALSATPTSTAVRRLARVTLALWTLGAIGLAWPAARGAGAQILSVMALWLCLILAQRTKSASDWATGPPRGAA